MKRKVCFLGFCAYFALMCWLLFGRDRFAAPMGYWQQVLENINYRPFETIDQFVGSLIHDSAPGLKQHAVVNLVGNVIMFIPLGFFTATLWKAFRPLWKCLLLGAGIILCVELTQLFALVGSCDFDDLLLNVVGIGLGYGLYRLTFGRKKR